MSEEKETPKPDPKSEPIKIQSEKVKIPLKTKENFRDLSKKKNSN